MSFGVNGVIYPKNDAISRALGVHLYSSLPYRKHRKQYKGANTLQGQLQAGKQEKSFFRKSWDWLKEVDYEKWFGILKSVATALALPEQDTWAQRPGELWSRYGECVPPDLLLAESEWANRIQDPKLLDCILQFRAAVQRFKTDCDGKSTYLYPEVKWVDPEDIVASDPRKTYENIIANSGKIPPLDYVQGLGWVLHSRNEKDQSWFTKFCFLYDGHNREKNEESFLKIRGGTDSSRAFR